MGFFHVSVYNSLYLKALDSTNRISLYLWCDEMQLNFTASHMPINFHDPKLKGGGHEMAVMVGYWQKFQ